MWRLWILAMGAPPGVLAARAVAPASPLGAAGAAVLGAAWIGAGPHPGVWLAVVFVLVAGALARRSRTHGDPGGAVVFDTDRRTTSATGATPMRHGGPGRRSLVASAVLLGALTAASGARAQAASPEPDEAAVLATLPFLEAVSPGAVFVDLAPEDAHRRLPLQLDTGASSSMLTPDLARELGVRVRRSKRTPYRRSTRLGRDLEFFVADRRGETGFGLLGGNFLAAYVVEVDWGARRVRLLDPARFEVPETTSAPDEAVLPARMVGNRPVVEIGVGGATIPVLLDTGASFGVLLGAEVAERLGIRGRTAPGLRAVGVKGPIDVEFVLLEEVALGALVFGRVPSVVAPEGLRQQATANDSLVGQDLLATCTLRVDYPRRRVWLRRREGAAPRFLGASWPSVQRSGALLYRRGEQIFVGVVLPDGPAARRGMRPGDVLADVDADAPGFDPEEAHARLAGDAPLRVRRAVGGGRSRTLVLEPPATSTDRP